MYITQQEKKAIATHRLHNLKLSIQVRKRRAYKCDLLFALFYMFLAFINHTVFKLKNKLIKSGNLQVSYWTSMFKLTC